jgi:protein-S-isoprenylcysteine O-methyltransferase Ste14
VRNCVVPEVPTPQEFRRIYRRMDLPTRSRLTDLALKGEVGADAAEAALVAARARRLHRGRVWLPVLQTFLLLLVVVQIVLTSNSGMRVLGAIVAAVGVVALSVVLIRNPRTRALLSSAERRNRELASQAEQN